MHRRIIAEGIRCSCSAFINYRFYAVCGLGLGLGFGLGSMLFVDDLSHIDA
jgi:hypothetical protein